MGLMKVCMCVAGNSLALLQNSLSPSCEKDISSMFSAYATVVLAVERFLAVWRPVEYHIMMTATGNRYTEGRAQALKELRLHSAWRGDYQSHGTTV